MKYGDRLYICKSHSIYFTKYLLTKELILCLCQHIFGALIISIHVIKNNNVETLTSYKKNHRNKKTFALEYPKS